MKFCEGLHPLSPYLWRIWNDIPRYMSTKISFSGWCESTLTSSSFSEIEIWRHDMCNLWATSVPFSKQIQHSDHRNQYKEWYRWAGVIWKWKVNRDTYLKKKSLFDWCINYQHLKEQHVKEVMVLVVTAKGWQEGLHLLWRKAFWIWGNMRSRMKFKY